METDTQWRPPGPSALDDTAWPEQLLARAIETGGDEDRLHGYSVLSDVAKHYRYSDFVYLAIVGELPDAVSSKLFELALFSFSTPSVGEAPLHVAVLARLSGAPLASALGAGLAVAADQAHVLVKSCERLFEWAHDPAKDLPDELCGPPDPHVEMLRNLADRLEASSLLRPAMTRDVARVALLYMAGLRVPAQLEAAVVLARVGAITAEALATGPQHLSLYPVKVPEFRYVETDPAPAETTGAERR